jgi:hypothetical protein
MDHPPYRFWLGAGSILLDVTVFVVGHVLVLLRRNFQPTKVNSPPLMLAMLYHKIISIVRFADHPRNSLSSNRDCDSFGLDCERWVG